MKSVKDRALAASLACLASAALWLVFAPMGCGGRLPERAPIPAPTPTPKPDNYLKSLAPVRWRQDIITYRLTGKPLKPWADAVDEGVHRWEHQVPGVPHVVKARDGEVADVTIAFVDTKWLNDPGESGTIGLTYLAYKDKDPRQTVVGAQVGIYHLLPTNRVTDVACHEWGHVLGMRGHSPDSHDLMAENIPLLARLTDRDTNTMAAIYRNP